MEIAEQVLMESTHRLLSWIDVVRLGVANCAETAATHGAPLELADAGMWDDTFISLDQPTQRETGCSHLYKPTQFGLAH